MKNFNKLMILLTGVALTLPLLSSCGGASSSASSEKASSALASSSVSSEASSSSILSEATVTFSLNYEGAPVYETVKVAIDGTITKPNDPTRTGYVFTGWFTDAAATSAFDFTTPISASLTLYAGWEAVQVGDTYTVTFYYNYEGNADAYYTATVKRRKKVTAPTAPTRDGFYFTNWYTEAACTTLFDFDLQITDNISLYAHWVTKWTFEAEYVDLDGKLGFGYSGNFEGTDMIGEDRYGAGASNGYYVSYLYYNGSELEFDVNAEKATDNVYLLLRLSVEFFSISLDDSTYFVTVNDTKCTGYVLNLSGAYEVGTGKLRAFDNYLISSSVHLNEGKNVIKLIVNNNNKHGGTVYAESPIVDCLYLCTDTALTWNPHTDNIKGK